MSLEFDLDDLEKNADSIRNSLQFPASSMNSDTRGSSSSSTLFQTNRTDSNRFSVPTTAKNRVSFSDALSVDLNANNIQEGDTEGIIESSTDFGDTLFFASDIAEINTESNNVNRYETGTDMESSEVNMVNNDNGNDSLNFYMKDIDNSNVDIPDEFAVTHRMRHDGGMGRTYEHEPSVNIQSPTNESSSQASKFVPQRHSDSPTLRNIRNITATGRAKASNSVADANAKNLKYTDGNDNDRPKTAAIHSNVSKLNKGYYRRTQRATGTAESPSIDTNTNTSSSAPVNRGRSMTRNVDYTDVKGTGSMFSSKKSKDLNANTRSSSVGDEHRMKHTKSPIATSSRSRSASRQRQDRMNHLDLPNTEAIDNVITQHENDSMNKINVRECSESLLYGTSKSDFKYLKTKETLKLEAEQAFEKVCNFKPNLYTSRGRSRGASSSPQRSRGVSTDTDRIEQMQLKYKQSMENREKQRLLNESIDVSTLCTFTPKISKGSEKIMKIRKRQANAQLGMESENESEFESDFEEDSIGKGKYPYLKSDIKNSDKQNDRMNVNRSIRSTRSSSPSIGRRTNPASSVSERLYEDASIKTENIRWLKSKIDTDEKSQCSYKPFIAPSTNHLLFEKNAYEYIPLHERVGELQKIKQNKIHEISKNVENEEKAKCTFSPAINKKHVNKSMNNTSTNVKNSNTRYPYYDDEFDDPIENNLSQNQMSSSLNVSDRLFDKGIEYTKRKHELVIKQEVEEAIKFNYFKPKLCKGSEKLYKNAVVTNSSGFHETAATDFETNPTDAEIDINLNKKKLSSFSFQDRQLLDMRRRKQNLMESYKILNDRIPTTNYDVLTNTNNSGGKLGYSFGKPKDGEHNNSNEPSMKATTIGNLQGEHEHSTKQWFNPTIHSKQNSEQILKEKKPELYEESQRAFNYRISNQEYQRKQSLHKQLDSKIYNDPVKYSYKPKIVKMSQIIGKKSNITELYENRKGKQRKEAIIRNITNEKDAEYTFRPNINKYPHHSNSIGNKAVHSPEALTHECYLERVLHKGEDAKVNTYTTATPTINMREPEKMARDIRLQLREREEKRRQQLAIQEIEELKHCSFQPDTSATKRYYKYPHAPQGPLSPNIYDGGLDLRYTSPCSYIAQENKQTHLINHGESVTMNEENTSIKSAQHMIVIKGIERHLELRRLAEQQKIDKENREKEVFHVQNVDSYRRPEDSSTIVKVNMIMFIQLICIIIYVLCFLFLHA